MTRVWRRVFTIGLLFCATANADIVVQVDGQSAGLTGHRMNLDGNFVGLVGDSIVLPGNQHELAVELPQGFWARQDLRVQAGVLSATAKAAGACINSQSLSLKDWPAAVQQSGSTAELHLAAAHPAVTGGCSESPSMMKCTEEAAIVNVSAVPEIGAEIWIDGKSVKLQTPASVSVPHCVGMIPRANFVLRKAGYSNCGQVLNLTGQAGGYTFSCSLKPLAAASVPQKP